MVATMRAAPSLAAVLVAAAVVTGCGQSKADKASDQVCSARADLQKQVEELSSLTATTATADGVKQNLQAIRDDLEKIADAQPDLNAERKQQVQDANEQFTSQLSQVAGELGSSLSASDGGTQLQDAFNSLAASYKSSFARVEC
jgi:uncharacterized phage infection (PIP) family protein YhgE